MPHWTLRELGFELTDRLARDLLVTWGRLGFRGEHRLDAWE